MHQHNRKSLLPAICAGALTLTAAAAVCPLPMPPPSDCVDTESSCCVPLAGWRDDSRRFYLHLTDTASPTTSVQCAFGTDRNADGDLAPEETYLVLGLDCGEWFVRHEHDVSARTPWAERPDRLLPRTDGRTLYLTSAQLARTLPPDADLLKITTRGTSASAATIAVELRRVPTLVIIR